MCGLSLLLVLSFTRRGFSGFPSHQKPTHSDSIRNQVGEEPLSECAAYKPLLIYFKVTFNLN